MRKALICLIALLCLCAVFASAETNWYITNCAEWVSMRNQPSQSAERLAKIPLGAQLEDVNGIGARNGAWRIGDCGYQKGLVHVGNYIDPYLQDVAFGFFVLVMIILSIDRSKATRGIAVK